MNDPVLAKRERIRNLSDLGQRIGYSCFALAVVLFVVAFVWTHPRHRDDAFSTPLEVAVVSYCLIVVVVAICLVPFAVLRLARPASHDTNDRVRVWKVDDKEPDATEPAKPE